MDELDERIRGADAEQLLKNKLLIEALATIESNVVNRLAMPDIKPDDIIRMQAILAGKRAFERYLAQIITTGKMAALQEQKRSMFDRLRSA